MTYKKQELNTKFDFFKPFGPAIGRFELPQLVVDVLMNTTDQILASDERESMGERLAGQIAEEPLVSKDVLRKTGLERFFKSYAKNYVEQFYKQGFVTRDSKFVDVGIDINSCWIVSQYENEYNPVHFHTKCTISSVLYLKMPNNRPRNIPNKPDLDGFIEWAYHATVPGSLEIGTFTYKPEIGVLYMWPSHLLHTVYPFQGPGERRSVAFNATHTLKK